MELLQTAPRLNDFRTTSLLCSPDFNHDLCSHHHHCFAWIHSNRYAVLDRAEEMGRIGMCLVRELCGASHCWHHSKTGKIVLTWAWLQLLPGPKLQKRSKSSESIRTHFQDNFQSCQLLRRLNTSIRFHWWYLLFGRIICEVNASAWKNCRRHWNHLCASSWQQRLVGRRAWFLG